MQLFSQLLSYFFFAINLFPCSPVTGKFCYVATDNDFRYEYRIWYISRIYILSGNLNRGRHLMKKELTESVFTADRGTLRRTFALSYNDNHKRQGR